MPTKIKWRLISSDPPEGDVLCVVALRSADGEVHVSNYPHWHYGTGIQLAADSPVVFGFIDKDVVAWFPFPAAPTPADRGNWVLIDEGEGENYPPRKGIYLTFSYSHLGDKKIKFAYYHPDQLSFPGHPDVIAWLPIPKIPVQAAKT